MLDCHQFSVFSGAFPAILFNPLRLFAVVVSHQGASDGRSCCPLLPERQITTMGFSLLSGLEHAFQSLVISMQEDPNSYY